MHSNTSQAVIRRQSMRQNKQFTPIQQACDMLVEGLESRTLLSAVMSPGFRRIATFGSGTTMSPRATTSPATFNPTQLRKAYGVDSISFSGVVGDGTGQTIAIVDAYNAPTIKTDLASFNTRYGLPTSTLTIINQTGGTSLPGNDPSGAGNSWALETSMDVEWAHVIAPQATILLVLTASSATTDLMKGVDTARKYAGVSAVSMSWGSDEASSDSSSWDSYFTTPSGHSGVTFLSASGDNGAYSDTGSTTKIVGYPAASKNVVAVGGTGLTTDSTGVYVSETGWGNGTSSRSLGGSGGGISKYIAKPSYQSAVTQSASFRTLPDVSLLADSNTGVYVVDSYDNGDTSPFALGGTSLATPMWGGLIAIANQGRLLGGKTALDGATQTLPTLYTLSSTDFHDITSGNNGYAASAGYDLVTGLGSPIANKLIVDLAGGSSSTPTPVITTFTTSPTSVPIGTSSTLTASGVTETGGTISSVSFYRESNGTAGLQIGSDTLVGAGSQSGTTWTSSVSTGSLAAATYTFYAVATDASNVSSATKSATLTVTTPTTPTPVISTFTASPTSVVIGTPTTLTATGVTETGGTISNVIFYRESNGTAGLQIGSDTVVGTGTASGTTYSISAATTGLSAGNYTFYAVATDASNVKSAVSSATVAVTTTTTTVSGTVLAWDVASQTNYGTQGLIAGTVISGVTNTTGLTRASGVSTTPTAASSAWGGKNWQSTSAAGISANAYIYFGFTVATGKTVSLSSISMNYRRSASGAISGLWQYQLNTGAWTTISSVSNEFSSTSASGAAMSPVGLSSSTGLQNIPAGTNVSIRLVPFGGTSTAGTFYVYNMTGNDLSLAGSVSSSALVRKVPVASNVFYSGPAKIAGVHDDAHKHWANELLA